MRDPNHRPLPKPGLIFAMTIALSLVITDPIDAALTPHERDINTALERTLKYGKIVRLTDSGDPISAIFSESTVRQTQGAVLIVHDLGLSVATPDFVQPLQRYLPEHGWSTLATQLPDITLAKDLSNYRKIQPQATRRIASAIKYLQDQNLLNIAVIGHGFGAIFAIDYLSKQPQEDIKALVIVALPHENRKVPSGEINTALAKIEIPIFDLYGNRERESTNTAAKNRKIAMKQHANYRQLIFDEMTARFADTESDLAKRIYSWLMRVSPGVQIKGRQ